MRWDNKGLAEFVPKDRVYMSHYSKRSYLYDQTVNEGKRNKTESITQNRVSDAWRSHVRVNSSYTTKSFKQENLQNDLFFTGKNSSPMAFTTATLEKSSHFGSRTKTSGLVPLSAHSSFEGNLN
jgi:hypothetical protein